MLNFTSFDIMADLAFGAPLGLLEKAEYTPWVRTTFVAIKMLTFRMILGYYFPWTSRLMPYLIPESMKRKRAEHLGYAAAQVDARLAKETDRPDIWTLVLREEKAEAEGKKARLSTAEMHSNAGVFMIAGTETTATALSGMVYLLLKHPDRLSRLKEEIYGNFKSVDEMTLEKLPHLPYLNAVINESMRLYPAAPESLVRAAPAQGAEICGKFVPAGTTAFILHYCAFRSPHNWALPDAFVPERWLSDCDPIFAKDDKKVFQPFSVGPRNCIGRNLAMHEIRLILTSLIWHFDLELCEQSANWNDQKTFSLWDKGPLMVKFSKAKGLP
ncbi:Cytochrome P450 [Macrophomina phaseolina MS6]|uniref:Cytochrome P450 n=2 Tax=Macrophomina phaseolina TaxID=35725 RepID=K2QP95_MACPH|nr:Cytochrome P450 [Macrophomina phaseolina MS6]